MHYFFETKFGDKSPFCFAAFRLQPFPAISADRAQSVKKRARKSKRPPKRPDIIRPTATAAAEKKQLDHCGAAPPFAPHIFCRHSGGLRRQADRIHKKTGFFITDEHTPQNTLSLIQALSSVGIILLHESTEDPISDALSRQNIPHCRMRCTGGRLPPFFGAH